MVWVECPLVLLGKGFVENTVCYSCFHPPFIRVFLLWSERKKRGGGEGRKMRITVKERRVERSMRNTIGEKERKELKGGRKSWKN